MFWIFLSLAIVDSVFLPGVAVWGYLVGEKLDPQTHVAAGLVASVFTVFVHSLVFVYFMGSSKSLKDAVLRHELPLELLEPATRERKRAFPWAWGASSMAVFAAILGGGVWAGFLPGWLHGTVALVCVLVAWLAFFVELPCIWRNGRVIDEVRAQISRRPENAPEKEVEEHLGLIPFGKGMIITGCSVWALFAYMKFIMRIEVHPLPWFAIVSISIVGIGVWALRRNPTQDPPR